MRRAGLSAIGGLASFAVLPRLRVARCARPMLHSRWLRAVTTKCSATVPSLAATAAAVAIAAAARAQAPVAAWQGPWNIIPEHQNPDPSHCCEITHAMLLTKPGPHRGKVLLVQSSGEVWLWNPATPGSATFLREPGAHDETTPDASEPPFESLFCSGHSIDSNGDVVFVGGHRYTAVAPDICGRQPTWSYVFDPATLGWSREIPLLTPQPTPVNFGYWYSGTVRLHDGRVLAAGGGSAPLFVAASPCHDQPGSFFVDGWQVFDPTAAAWRGQAANRYFDGLPTGANGYDYDFNYYPILMLIPPSPGTVGNAVGYVFAPVVTDNDVARHQVPGAPPVVPRSPSALLPVGGPGWPARAHWTIHASQITDPAPNGKLRNLQYPTAVLRPLRLDSQGRPAEPARAMVLGGGDWNLGSFDPPVGPFGYWAGGGYAVREVSQISAPEQGSAWTAGQGDHPNQIRERIYSNSVLLPDGTLLVVGGSKYNYFPYSGGIPYVGNVAERVAEPVFEPELLDLLAPNPQWQLQPPHVSPRLYHSSALLLPDGSVLVVGGHRGERPFGIPSRPAHFTWGAFLHSDVEIFRPAYLSAGPRPQIEALTVAGAASDVVPFGSTFEIRVQTQGTAASQVGMVTLISSGAFTHHYGWDQRMLRLDFQAVPGSSKRLTVHAPADGGVAPPGWYMLFVTSNGASSGGVRIPSVARFVKLQ